MIAPRDTPRASSRVSHRRSGRTPLRLGSSPSIQRIDIARPRVRTEDSKDRDGKDAPTVPAHLMSDGSGTFPVSSLNDWERQVLKSEMAQPGFLAWYRNPSRASQDALAV